MSGTGSPDNARIDGAGKRLAIVAGRWHGEIADALLDGAVTEARLGGVRDEDVEVLRAPGAFELPVVAEALASSKRVDGIVCLGVVIRGGTPHFDYVCRAVTDGCLRVSLDHRLPVGFGVLTVDDLAQARERLDKGREAVRAVLETLSVLDDIRGRS
ncbi:MAG TPA: 6,7-dimethyl-8-ribityllumazine synthase [Frankiaceae bacterium]|nr:6,7-dimethyl-8-ribityllumazine synthase [Frankiaceae bacterium]